MRLVDIPLSCGAVALANGVEDVDIPRRRHRWRGYMEAFVVWVTDWFAQGACREDDPDKLFVQGAAQNRAKQICGGCPVRVECLADALDNQIEFGVWGGMTERERRALLRRRPEVTSWAALLEQAREHYQGGTATPAAAPRRGRIIA